ncbi:hypothetical protein ACQUY5_16635 [Bacillus cereus]|uniref:hypothetical protein n=1 Tax=Bacillus cereus TaxID=1396 RepID=UPI003D1638FE
MYELKRKRGFLALHLSSEWGYLLYDEVKDLDTKVVRRYGGKFGNYNLIGNHDKDNNTHWAVQLTRDSDVNIVESYNTVTQADSYMESLGYTII